MAKIFICYRRADSGGHAGRLYDRLVPRFGKNRVYMDIDSIPPGADFVEEVQKALKDCAAVIVVIGQSWFSGDNRNRLNMPGDHVRQEIVQALKLKVKVFPVLVHGARMPPEKELPRDVQPLARKHAIEIRDVSFTPDCQQLIRALERVEGLKPSGGRPGAAASGAKQARSTATKRSGGTGGGGARTSKRAPTKSARVAGDGTTGSGKPTSETSGAATGGRKGSRNKTAKADTRTKADPKATGAKSTSEAKRTRSSSSRAGPAESRQPKTSTTGARGGSAGGGRRPKSTAKGAGRQGAKRKSSSPGKRSGGT